MEYPYVKYLNQSTTNYPVTKLVNRFIARDRNKEYAFEVAFFCGTGRQTTGAKIKVYKPDFINQKLVFLGVVDAGTNLSPSDLDTGQVEAQNSQCEFEEYFVDVYPQYRVFEFEINTTNTFECDVEAETEFLVNWGDGESTMYSSGSQTITHTYSTAQQRTVTLTSTNKEFLTALDFKSDSSVAFNLNQLPQGLESLRLFQVSNLITGDIKDIPLSVTYFEVYGSNTITGSLYGIRNHEFDNFIVAGNNTISDDIRYVPETVTQLLLIYGQNTTHGDIFNMRARPQYVSIAGNTSVTGNIRWLQPQTTQMDFIGQNTLSGNIQVLASGVVTAQFQGANTTTGDVGLTPSGLVVLYMLGNASPSSYTTKVWSANMQIIYLGTGLTTPEIDQLLIDLSATTWFGDKIIDIAGTRSAASDAAVLSLEAQGVTVTVA